MATLYLGAGPQLVKGMPMSNVPKIGASGVEY